MSTSHVGPRCSNLDVIPQIIIENSVVLAPARDQLHSRWHIRFGEWRRRLHDGTQGQGKRRGRAQKEASLFLGRPKEYPRLLQFIEDKACSHRGMKYKFRPIGPKPWKLFGTYSMRGRPTSEKKRPLSGAARVRKHRKPHE